MNSLENQLETAYAAVMQGNEPAVEGVPVRLATLILAQPPRLNGEEDEDSAETPAEYILLTAKRGKESLIGRAVFEIPLTVEVGINATLGSKNGRLDAIFRAASNVFRYKTISDDPPAPPNSRSLFDALTAAVDGFRCFGMPDRGTEEEMQMQGSMVMRRSTGTFICGATA